MLGSTIVMDNYTTPADTPVTTAEKPELEVVFETLFLDGAQPDP